MRSLSVRGLVILAGAIRANAYNSLRTLHAEGFVGYDEATPSYLVSLHSLELANGVLRHGGLIDRVSGDVVDYAIEEKTAWMDCQRFPTELQLKLRQPWISTPSSSAPASPASTSSIGCAN